MLDYLELSIVVPVYNEEESIDLFLETVIPILEGINSSFEIVFINDGSRDETLRIVMAANENDGRVKGIDLSRNFGKEAALSAGLDFAKGKCVIPMDVDLQDPPELIPEMVAAWQQGYDVVLAKRADRSSDTWMKRKTSDLFYKLMHHLSDVPIPDNVGDFRLMDRKVIDALKLLPERTRFMKGMFAWLGFKTTTITYVRAKRAAGTTKWKPLALLRLGLEGLVSFSTFPLRLASYIGTGCAMIGFLYGAFIVLRTVLLGIDLPGYASLISATIFFNGLILLALGIIGEYIARVVTEVKHRPVYLVRETIG